jgi:hypothetical protein
MFDSLAEALASAGVGEPAGMAALDPPALVAVIESTYRMESMLMARRLAAVAALRRARVAAGAPTQDRPGHAVIDGDEQTAAEVAAVMNLSAIAASYVVCHAEALDVRLPRLAALLAAGRTDWRTVRLIIGRTDLITDPAVLTELDAALSARITGWHGWSKQRIINAVDAAVRVADPDAARERRTRADDDRYIAVSPGADGMAQVYGTVAAAAAAAFDRRLSQLATAVCADDPRTLDQRRADALAALSQGRPLPCGCGQSGCPRRADAAGPHRDARGAQVVISVIADAQTVSGRRQQPGYLDGYGLIDAEQVRALAQAASLRWADLAVSAAETLRYQPSAALERAIRARDLTCRFPGCHRRATHCDVDHTIPFNHADPAAGGLTVPGNLKCLCRQHHRLKTFGGWRDRQLEDGTVIWTSPTGQTYRTQPAGADLFAPARAPACAPPAPRARSRAKQRAARITASRNHNHRQRPINQARRHLEQARKQEIASREFRNHMRDMLFLFKGTPSTSPFCTWVNDPREPEELPPDWQPPPPPLPLPDDPPF